MEIPLLGRALHDRRSQKLTGALPLTNQWVQGQRTLGVLTERLYQDWKLPHREATRAGGLWSVAAESAGFQTAEVENVPGD